MEKQDTQSITLFITKLFANVERDNVTMCKDIECNG